MRGAAVLVLTCCALSASGCGTASTVQRAYDGAVVAGPPVSAEAYAAFLRGAVAEAQGNLDDAVVAYEEATERRPEAVEAWTRLGDALCRRSPRDLGWEVALDRAVAIDDRYAPAWSARARCALRRGDHPQAEEAARRAAALSPSGNVPLEASARPSSDPEERTRMLALTATAREPAAAWHALAEWARSRGDLALWSDALQAVAHWAPGERDEIAADAETLAGMGRLVQARSVASAALDAAAEPLRADHPLAARLAVDDAVAHRDESALRRRMSRGRLGVSETAARAMLAGDVELSRPLAHLEHDASPRDGGAGLLLAASDGGVAIDLTQAAALGPLDAAVAVAFGVASARNGGATRAREILRAAGLTAMISGDDLVERPAVQLALMGVLDERWLSSSARVELGVVRGNLAGRPDDFAALDLRHRYLGAATLDPRSATAESLRRQMHGEATDALVAAADALMSLASDHVTSPDASKALLVINPADPLLAAVALRVARHVGDAPSAAQARRTLAALGAPTLAE